MVKENELTKSPTNLKFEGKPVYYKEYPSGNRNYFVKISCKTCGEKTFSRRYRLKKDNMEGEFCSDTCAQNNKDLQDNRVSGTKYGSKRSAVKDSKSKYKGVFKCPRTGNWRSRVRYKGNLITVGTFKSETKAAKEYDKKAKTLFEDPKLNILDD